MRTFPATAGQKLTLRIIGNTFTEADVTIRDPSGGTVVSLFVDAPTGSATCSRCRSTGTYTITVDPRGQQTGTMTFLLVAGARQHGDDGDRDADDGDDDDDR